MKISAFLNNFSERLATLAGWRRYGLVWLLGILASLAFPPFNVLPLIFICVPMLIWILQGATGNRQAFAIGWWFAFGLLILNLYWIAGALFVDIGSHWWALPLAVLGLPALFAIYYALAAWLAFRWGLKRPSGILLFGILWFVADYARGHLFTGFPWAIMGYVWSDILPIMQTVSLIGIYGLTLITTILIVVPALLAGAGRVAVGKWLLVLVALVLASTYGWGSYRLHQGSTAMVPDVYVRIVQAHTNQATKWLKSQREANFAQLLDTTFAPSQKPITHYIWPETATPFYLADDTDRRRMIAERMEPNSHLITGLVRRYPQSDGTAQYFNSLIAMDARANIVAGYDKFHLVPFGEYFPFRDILPGGALTALGVDFSFGEGLRTLRVAGLPPFSPLICYEAIFPSAVVDETDQPQLMINVTNDAWYAGTTGPYQHFLISRTRAIEEGIPMIRVANRGTTAVTDAYGRSVAEIGMDQAGFVDSALPQALPEPSWFSRHRLLILLGLFFAGISGVLGLRLMRH